MTQSEQQAREQQARALVALVRKVEGGYRVGSTRDPNTGYFVSKVDGQICCSCPDFEKHFQEGGPLQGRGPGWACKHVLAVKLAHKLGKVNGNGANKAQADPSQGSGQAWKPRPSRASRDLAIPRPPGSSTIRPFDQAQDRPSPKRGRHKPRPPPSSPPKRRPAAGRPPDLISPGRPSS